MPRITLSYVLGILCLIFLLVTYVVVRLCDCFSLNAIALIFSICGPIVIIVAIYYTKEFIKYENIIFNIESIPLSKTNQATPGVPFACEGIIEAEEKDLLKSPYTNTPCVYFHSIKEKKFWYGANLKDWIIVENIAKFIPFWIKDEKGKLKIDITNLDNDFSDYAIPLKDRNVPDPRNSEIDCEAILKDHILFYQKDLFRLNEFVLKPKTKVFVYGMVSRRNGELVLHEAEGYPLIISRKNRDKYVHEFYQGADLIYLSYVFIASGFTVGLLALNYFLKIDVSVILRMVIVGNLIILASMIISLYNRIITLKHRALNALSNIKVELKRRADLISNIIEVIKGYAKHEKEIQEIITEARADISFSKNLEKDKKLVINSLIAVIENYPDLKASDNFQELINLLVSTEERIAYSREFYNRTVRKFNTLIKQIPFSIIASLLGIKEMEFINIVRG